MLYMKRGIIIPGMVVSEAACIWANNAQLGCVIFRRTSIHLFNCSR